MLTKFHKKNKKKMCPSAFSTCLSFFTSLNLPCFSWFIFGNGVLVLVTLDIPLVVLTQTRLSQTLGHPCAEITIPKVWR